MQHHIQSFQGNIHIEHVINVRCLDMPTFVLPNATTTTTTTTTRKQRKRFGEITYTTEKRCHRNHNVTPPARAIAKKSRQMTQRDGRSGRKAYSLERARELEKKRSLGPFRQQWEVRQRRANSHTPFTPKLSVQWKLYVLDETDRPPLFRYLTPLAERLYMGRNVITWQRRNAYDWSNESVASTAPSARAFKRGQSVAPRPQSDADLARLGYRLFGLQSHRRRLCMSKRLPESPKVTR